MLPADYVDAITPVNGMADGAIQFRTVSHHLHQIRKHVHHRAIIDLRLLRDTRRRMRLRRLNSLARGRVRGLAITIVLRPLLATASPPS